MKIKSVFFISFLLFVAAGYTLLQHKSIQAETVTKVEPEHTHEETVEIRDSAGNVHADTLLIVTDTLFVEEPELGIIDTIPYTDTLNLTEVHEKQQDSIHTSSKRKIYSYRVSSFPNLFHHPLSHSLMAKDDSIEVMNYLLKEAFPQKKFSRYFGTYPLYEHSDEFDIKKSRVLIRSSFGGAPIHAPFALGLQRYITVRFQEQLYELMIEDIDEAEQLRIQERQAQGIIPDIEFPKIKMSKSMRRFFGDNIGRLKVTGSQKITIGGSSTRTNKAASESTKKGFFPDLKMEQKLDLGISGTIGKKIKVDVRQTSDKSIFESNKISIKYEGDEDDPIKLIDVGDTQLSLSGSEFVSYSASSGDLFGIKGQFEFGKLKLTTIVSQQEGKQASATATGNATEQTRDYFDKGFARNKYFLFDEPENLFVGPDNLPVNPDTLPMTEWAYIDDKMPDPDAEVRIFICDWDQATTTVTGYGLDDPEQSYGFYEVTDKINGFFIDYTFKPYMIQFGVSIYDNYVIGVIYKEKSGKQWGNYNDGVPTVKIIKGNYNVPDDQLDDAKWDYQIKNIYSLGGTNIDSDNFEMNIFYYPPGGGGRVAYGVKADSGDVEDKFINILDLDTNNDGIVNGSDRTVDLQAGIAQFRMWEPFQPYWFSKYDTTLGNPEVYDERNPDIEDYNPFYISVKSSSVGSTISLGQINIIEGSEKVYINGELAEKDVDYTIDYFLGTVTLKGDAAGDPSANIKVDYEYKPIFSLDQKSMFGFRADYEFSDDAKIGATFIYEGASASSKHVKVGGEPTKTFVGDIDGSIKTELPFVTDLVDMIPLVRTNETSTVKLSGEVAMNIPNPNATDKGEAYIDDMEAINETFSVGISRSEYDFASYPIGIDTLMDSSRVTRGDFIWYNPYNAFQRKNIYPDLPDVEGNEYVSVLECKLEPLSLLPNWGGIMKGYGQAPENFSKKRYLELTFKVDNPIEGDTLFLNFGTISEDYYPITHPNDSLNYEDRNEDGVLDVGEDTGLDIVQGVDPVPPKSHEFDGQPGIDDGNDDFYYKGQGDLDYSRINNLEKNDHLDTEDLNDNGILDTRNNYFQYAIDLTNIDSEVLISEYNGWKFVRIPIQDTLFFKPLGQGTVAWDYIETVRLWMKTESSHDLVLDVETFELVGNKWIASAIMDTTLHKPSNLQPDEVFEIATENNESNLDYTPPPGALTGEGSDKEKEIEQSLVLKIENLEPNRYIYAKENFSDKLNLLNYSKVKLWVYAQHATGPPPNASNTETIIFRLGEDTSNYYEYRQSVQVYDDIDSKMLESRWQDITIDFTEFTDLKKDDVPDTTARLRIVGSPSLGYIKQIAVGLIRPDSMQTTFSGRIFFDDIRVSDAYSAIGMATRLTLNTKFADFSDFKVNFTRKTPNFYSLGGSGGSNADSYSYSLHNGLYLHKFFPGEWGFNIPLKLDYSYSESRPRFKPDSDVELTTTEEKDKYKTRTEAREASISLQKSKKSNNFFAKLFFDNTYIRATAKQSKTLSPTKRDTTTAYTGIFNYTLNIGDKLLTLNLWDKFKIFFIPQKIVLNTNYDYRRNTAWTKSVDDSLFLRDDQTPVQTFKPELTVNYKVFTDFDARYALNTTRDLQKKNKVGKINIGVETTRNQNVHLEYAPSYLSKIQFNTKYETIYKQNRQENLEESDTLSVEYEVENQKNTSVGLTLTFREWGSKIMELIEIEKVVEVEEDEAYQGLGSGEIEERELSVVEGNGVIEEELEEDSNIEEIIDSVDTQIDTLSAQEEVVEVEERTSSFGIKKLAMYMTKVVGFSVKILGNANLSYTNSHKTQKDVPPDSLPDIYYQLGLNDRDATLIGYSDAYSANTNTTFQIFSFLSADISARYTLDLQKASGNKSKSESITLPGVALSFSAIDEILNAKFLSGSKLSSSFDRMITNTGSGFWDTPDQTTEKYQFSPLLSFNTKLFNKVNSNLGFNYNFSDQVSNLEDNTKTHIDELSLSLTLRYSFQASKGIKIPLFGRLKMTNKTDLDLDINYSSDKTQRKQGSKEWELRVHNNVLKIAPRLSYNFSRDINAGLTASFESSKNVKTGDTSTTTALNLWVEFKF